MADFEAVHRARIVRDRRLSVAFARESVVRKRCAIDAGAKEVLAWVPTVAPEDIADAHFRGRQWFSGRRPPSLRLPCRVLKWVDEVNVGEVPFVVGDNDTVVVGLRCRFDDRLERAAGTAARRAYSHESRLHEARLLVDGKDTTGAQRRLTLWACEPGLDPAAFAARSPLRHAAVDIDDGERGDEEILIGLVGHPRQQRRRWRSPGDVADDVGIDRDHYEFARSPRPTNVYAGAL